MSNHTEVEVDEFPKCDFCDQLAMYDCNLGRGWASVCQYHYGQYNCQLGLGKGQKYKLAK